MFEFETQDIDDLRWQKRFWVDESTGHVLWLESDELLCAPIGEDGFVCQEHTIAVDLEHADSFPDLACNNCQVRAILLRRIGEEEEAGEWEARARIYERIAKKYPDRCIWPQEDRRVRDYLLDIKKS